MGTGVLSTYKERLCRGVDHSLPSSAEVKNKCDYASTIPVCLHAGDRDNFNFSLNMHAKRKKNARALIKRQVVKAYGDVEV